MNDFCLSILQNGCSGFLFADRACKYVKYFILKKFF